MTARAAMTTSPRRRDFCNRDETARKSRAALGPKGCPPAGAGGHGCRWAGLAGPAGLASTSVTGETVTTMWSPRSRPTAQPWSTSTALMGV